MPVPVAAYTISAMESAAQAMTIDPPASGAVHRSGSGRLRIDAAPSSASRMAGAPTPTSTQPLHVESGDHADASWTIATG